MLRSNHCKETWAACWFGRITERHWSAAQFRRTPRRAGRTRRIGADVYCHPERRAPEELIRFVLGPDGTVVPDIRAKLPGRGVWVTARAELVREAVGRQAFSRGLKASAKADKDLAG